MKAKLTKRTVDAASPRERDMFLWDTEITGFGLKVTPVGNRIYILQYRIGGRLRRYTIGKHGSPWTPDKARDEAIRLRGMIANDIDPADVREQANKEITVSELCDLYMAEGVATKRPGTIQMDRSRIERHVKPLLGRRRVRSVTRADIERFMQDIAAGKTARDEKTGPRGRSIVRGGKGAATRTVGMLGAILAFAVNRGLRGDNPVQGVKRYADGKSERFLSPDELARLGDVLDHAEQEGRENLFAVAAIRLLIISGCRKAEILTLKWDHVDFEHGCLRLPESKTGAKIVPLGAPVLALLSALPRLEGNPYVLPGIEDRSHFVGLQRVWDRIRTRADLDGVRLHDLRHSFASVAVAGGDSLFLVGKVLGHRHARTTERYAHLSDDPLRAVANRTAEQIAAAMKAGNGSAEVVRLPKRKA